MTIQVRGCAISNGVGAKDSLGSLCAEARRLVATLQPHEHKLLVWLVDGYSLSRAAAELGVSLEDAVRVRSSLMEKLGATITADVVRVGIYAQTDEDC